MPKVEYVSFMNVLPKVPRKAKPIVKKNDFIVLIFIMLIGIFLMWVRILFKHKK